MPIHPEAETGIRIIIVYTYVKSEERGNYVGIRRVDSSNKTTVVLQLISMERAFNVLLIK